MYYNEKRQNQTQSFCQKEGGTSFTILMVIYVLISFFVQTTLSFITQPNSVLYLAVCSLSSVISIVAVIVFFVFNKCEKAQRVNLLGINKFNSLKILYAILLSAGMFLGLGFVNVKFNEILNKIGISTTSPTIPLENVWQFILFSITLAVFPAVAEEIFFRGILLSSLKNCSVIKRACAVGIVFALYHCNLVQFLYQFIYGFALSILAIYLKSIIPCIIAHFLNNFAVILFQYSNIYIDLYNLLVIGLGLLCLIAFCLMISFDFVKKYIKEKHVQKIIVFYFPYALFGILICLFMIISGLLI